MESRADRGRDPGDRARRGGRAERQRLVARSPARRRGRRPRGVAWRVHGRRRGGVGARATRAGRPARAAPRPRRARPRDPGELPAATGVRGAERVDRRGRDRAGRVVARAHARARSPAPRTRGGPEQRHARADVGQPRPAADRRRDARATDARRVERARRRT